MQINYILLGQRIRAIRTKKGISQMELAERVNRSAAYMSYVETAYKFCSLDTLVRVANALNVSTDDLLVDSLTNTIKVFFIGDLHFGHENVLVFDHRPFETVEEMDTELIRRWNHKVSKGDLVYVLGDFIWKTRKQTHLVFLPRKLHTMHPDQVYELALRKCSRKLCEP